MNKDEDYQSILKYWFGDFDSNLATMENKSALWWGKDVDTDREIRERFTENLALLQAGQLNEWKRLPESYLAMIILGDQFPRNIYRDSAEAFAFDELALKLTNDGIEKGIDLKLSLIQRVFFYLPLEHAESMMMQELSVSKQKQVMEEANENEKEKFAGFFDFAVLHREVIEQFGRYPHRNSILGRQSTSEELIYLSKPGAGF